ncbi:binding-protein-dependent transport systems inner membrane component [Xylanimonas cellulosilytica DSM 15894]|uniref:Binding-protein-dependent transport systems inner membrane component n=1 Tax=Xylanimonas cellulosilytica (strain DSM 15894 / JCM 12276 / CECT 5975 / KCTC 9989 / LMG 20990 / NBRC 107835 / XIL07) TaxID=446471 RepID=D1BWK0_XYLCX|nr:proline/glycine betaine ABC transporter permease [Xylanimonas cellulosilytica]ACZ31545.1 binding-protein-dependent transport systems inner membrane component [Xylanimonas cellulosilytica DSM 15894]
MTGTLVPRLPLGQWVDTFVDWVTATFRPLFRFIKDVLDGVYDGLDTILSGPPFWVVAIVLAALALFAKGWKLALGSLVGFVVIAGVNQWGNAMDTLALVLLSAAIALILAVPLGIWAARNERVSQTLRPVLDFMQTMPGFVYLIPTVVIFLTGPVPGIIATIIFAMAPGVRFTELGIRQVDKEVVEAGHAFGATPGRILRQIQLPLALPTVMAGVNQVIMLSLSMVVIAGMVGAGGLGNDVVAALQRVDVALGFEAGLAVVILAMFLDRVTSALGERAPVSRALAATRA